MKSRKTYTLHGMQGDGDTLAAAKSDATARLECLVADCQDVTPLALTVAGHVAFIWRDYYGWAYRVASMAQLAADPTLRSSIHLPSRHDALRDAAPFLVQTAWTAAVTDDRAFAEAYAATLPPPIDRQRLVNDFVRWTVFQRTFQARTAAGACRDDAMAAAYAARDAA